MGHDNDRLSTMTIKPTKAHHRQPPGYRNRRKVLTIKLIADPNCCLSRIVCLAKIVSPISIVESPVFRILEQQDCDNCFFASTLFDFRSGGYSGSGIDLRSILSCLSSFLIVFISFKACG